MMQLALNGVRVSYRDVEALRGVEMGVEPGEFFTIVGPTNAGKSSLLKTVAGLVRADAGSIELKGRDVTRLPPRERNVSLLFQNIALFPNQTGFDNIAFPLRVSGAGDGQIRERVGQLGELLRISHVLERMPRTFSGGEQQRVAIGRAIAAPADLLMLDEPLTNLDARIRIALRVEFKAIHQSLQQTLLYVTHDPVEAMSMSDRIAVLNEGKFEQVGTPDQIYHRPATWFVAEFFGAPPMNIISGRAVAHAGVLGFQAQGCQTVIPLAAPDGEFDRLPDELAVGVRPENVRVSAQQSPATPLSLPVLWVERYGSHSILDLKLGDAVLRVRVAPQEPAARVDTVWAGFDIGRENMLDTRSGKFLE